MKTYIIETSVESARGTQHWRVAAEDEVSALRLFIEGEGVIVAEEVEVTDIGKPRIVETKEVE